MAGTGTDSLPYSVMSYANGLGYNNAYKTLGGGRKDLREQNMASPSYRSPATALMASETHGGSDVGVYAIGPWARLFDGVYEQSSLPHLMAYAAQIGPFKQ